MKEVELLPPCTGMEGTATNTAGHEKRNTAYLKVLKVINQAGF